MLRTLDSTTAANCLTVCCSPCILPANSSIIVSKEGTTPPLDNGSAGVQWACVLGLKLGPVSVTGQKGVDKDLDMV